MLYSRFLIGFDRVASCFTELLLLILIVILRVHGHFLHNGSSFSLAAAKHDHDDQKDQKNQGTTPNVDPELILAPPVTEGIGRDESGIGVDDQGVLARR